eukprot:scaffold19766_cov122-Isochrysis_galbana.AAC.6
MSAGEGGGGRGGWGGRVGAGGEGPGLGFLLRRGASCTRCPLDITLRLPGGKLVVRRAETRRSVSPEGPCRCGASLVACGLLDLRWANWLHLAVMPDGIA